MHILNFIELLTDPTMSPLSFTDMVLDEVKKIAIADCLLVHNGPEAKKQILIKGLCRLTKSLSH
jgi:hypothetical protein